MFLSVLIIFYSIPLTASLSVFVNYTWVELQLLSRNLNLNLNLKNLNAEVKEEMFYDFEFLILN